ncbi:EthD family reductase [Methylobacterium sp. PvR107]|uniref:EthD family reductase n=1 Tax=Methylobacterium sp. PvR107 TaxID=2806597 RepID=UPI001AE989FF|nr:EthD family reductase [Methylobacterium sp. PvR107]MBP1181466.1 uncharacterized protein (TIGR02118 family) [Methylobacterium sp. PvR107]
MTRMIVVCAGDRATRFDRDYYATEHLALARECWGPYGLEGLDAFYPAGEGDGWLSVGVYRFREPGDVEAALAAPETARLMADVKNFTDAAVVMRSLFTPMTAPG